MSQEIEESDGNDTSYSENDEIVADHIPSEN